MPSINGAIKQQQQQQQLPGILADENKRQEKKKSFLDNVEMAKENINSMHSVANYNQLILKYKQAHLKDVDKSMHGDNINKIDNLLAKKKPAEESGEETGKHLTMPFIYSHNFEEKEKEKENEIADMTMPAMKPPRSPLSSEENFLVKKKFYQNMLKESPNETNSRNSPDIQNNSSSNNSEQLVDSLASSMSKKRVSFHEKVIETDVDSGNSIIKSIVRS